ncbi:MAG: phosphotransferase, partial [Limnobacter sp.]|nr:phosphotransferase [Limnobacter sp.]
MAVFTKVNKAELQGWMQGLACGELVALEEISSGIENTNYFVTTTKARYVLTLFEKLTASDLPFYLGLMQHLACKGLPVPGPVAFADGSLFKLLENKPATLVNCLQGQSVAEPTPQQCRQIGSFAARAHLAVRDFAGTVPNPRNLGWITEATHELRPHLPAKELALLTQEVA